MSVESFIDNNLGLFNNKKRSSNGNFELGCPFNSCPNHGQSQFYINKKTGAFYCHRCEEKGTNLKQLQFKMGLLEFKEKASSGLIIRPDKIKTWQNSLRKSPEVKDYLTNVRGFKLSTILQWRLGYTLVQGMPAVTIPYFDKTGKCVGVKYDFYKREEGPRYKKEAGSRTIAFNLDRLDTLDPVYITEGEWDAISLWQAGYMNVTSLPNGAGGISECWLSDLERVDKWFVCFDNDEKGQKAAENFSRVVGKSKCSRVWPRLKDWNDYLQAGIGKDYIDVDMQSAAPMFEPPVVGINQYEQDAVELFEHGMDSGGYKTGWKHFDDILGGFRLGEVSVISGLTGHGKTSWGLDALVNLFKNYKDEKALILSPEMNEAHLLLKLVGGWLDRNPETSGEIQRVIHLLQKRIYIANVFNSWTREGESLLDHVFDLVHYTIRNFGVQFILLDHLRLFVNPKNQDNERMEVENFSRQCVRTAVMYNVHIFLVCQPKHVEEKLQGKCKSCHRPFRRKITRADLKGTGNIAQDSHNVILIHRYKETYCACHEPLDESLVEVEVSKNRFLGYEGSSYLEFNIRNQSTYKEVSVNEEA